MMVGANLSRVFLCTKAAYRFDWQQQRRRKTKLDHSRVLPQQRSCKELCSQSQLKRKLHSTYTHSSLKMAWLIAAKKKGIKESCKIQENRDEIKCLRLKEWVLLVWLWKVNTVKIKGSGRFFFCFVTLNLMKKRIKEKGTPNVWTIVRDKKKLKWK